VLIKHDHSLATVAAAFVVCVRWMQISWNANSRSPLPLLLAATSPKTKDHKAGGWGGRIIWRVQGCEGVSPGCHRRPLVILTDAGRSSLCVHDIDGLTRHTAGTMNNGNWRSCSSGLEEQCDR